MISLMKNVGMDEDGQPDPTTVIPYIDGGSGGFTGQARIILPGTTACYECTADQLDKEEDPTHVSCTVATTPRNPGHCIQYVYLIEWKKVFGEDRQVLSKQRDC